MRFIEGLHTDNEPLLQPQGTWRDMLNGVISMSRGAVTCELGNKQVEGLPENHKPIGKILMDDDRIVVFSVNTVTSNSEIGLFRKGEYETLLNDANFAAQNKLLFPVRGYIEGEYRINSRLETLIYWTDGENHPRVLNIDRIPEIEFDINNLNLFARIEDIAKFDLIGINEAGGNLVTGAYQFAFAYVDDDLTASNYFTVTNPIFLIDDTGDPSSFFVDGAPKGTPTSKSISFKLANIDLNYKYVRIAVIIDTEVRVLPDVLIPESGELTYTYSGAEAYTVGDIAEVLINKVSYDKARAMKQVDGVLYLGNLSGKDDVDYQKYANNIQVEAVTQVLDPAVTGRGGTAYTYFRDEEATFYDRSFQRDEIYALYLSFVLKDGSETRAFHIPGREPEGGSAQGVGSIQTSYFNQSTKATGEILVSNLSGTGLVTVNAQVDDINVSTDINVDGTTTVDDIALAIVEALDASPAFTQEWTAEVVVDTPGLVEIKAKSNGTFWNNRTVDADHDASSVSITFINENTSGGTDAVGYSGTIEITIGVETIIASPGKALDGAAIAHSIRNSVNAHDDFIGTIDPADSSKVIVRTADNTDAFNGPIGVTADPPDPMFVTEDIIGGSGGGELSDFIDPDFSGLPDPKQFHMSGNPLANGMAYWHNENERYPTGDNWEVWEVVGGTGQAILEADGAPRTLAGKKVRHHHFPSANYTHFYSWGPAGSTADQGDPVKLGFKLTNIQIPDDIKDKVLGYKVYYAKRSSVNRTVLGQSLGIYGKEAQQDPDPSDEDPTTTLMYLPQEALEPSDSNLDNLLYLHPFRMMRAADEERPNIGSITHIKPVTLYEGFEDQSTATEDQYIVDSKAYAEHHSVVRLESLGFSNDLYNINGEKKIVIDTSSITPKNNYVWNLIAFRQDVYNSFDRQELVWTGYFEDDLDASESEDIYSGDTYIVEYYYRASDGPNDADRVLQRELVESTDNALWRHAGTQPWEIYGDRFWNFKDLEHALPEEATNASEVEEFYGYNDDYSQVNDTKPAIPSLKEHQEVNEYPTRVIRSAREDVSGVLDNFRTFLENDFLDLPRNRGEIVALKDLNGILVIHLERDLMRTRGREELITQDFRAYLGSGDIFSVRPASITTSDVGYAGLQDRMTAIVTQFGYFFVDREAGKVFVLSDGINEVSTKGMENWFKENLRSPLEDYDYDESEAAQTHVKLLATYDPRYDRIILTKKDFKPTDLFISGFELSPAPIIRWNSDSGVYELYDNGTETWNTIPVEEGDYFTEESWSVSYLLKQNIWISRHSYHPDFYLNDLNNFYSIIENDVWKHHDGDSGSYYGSVNPFEIEFVENQEPQQSKLVASLDIDSVVENGGAEVHDKPFDTIQITNKYQDSGEVTLVPFENCRRTERVWHVNGFRDTANIPTGSSKLLPKWAYKRRFEDKYHIIKLVFRNLSQNVVYLYNAYTQAKPSNR